MALTPVDQPLSRPRWPEVCVKQHPVFETITSYSVLANSDDGRPVLYATANSDIPSRTMCIRLISHCRLGKFALSLSLGPDVAIDPEMPSCHHAHTFPCNPLYREKKQSETQQEVWIKTKESHRQNLRVPEPKAVSTWELFWTAANKDRVPCISSTAILGRNKHSRCAKQIA